MLAPQVARGEPPPALRLEDAIRLSLSRNERARIAELNVDVADAAVSKAFTAFLPVLSASGQETLRPYETVKSGVTTQPYGVGNAALTVNQPVLNPSAFPLYAQAKAQRDGARAQTIDDRRQLAFDAAKAFFAVLSAESVLAAAERRLDTSKANLNDTQARAAAALSSSNDVTRAQIDLASAVREVETDRSNVAAAYVQLDFTLNVEAPRSLATPTALLAAGRAPVTATGDLVKEAVARRPDLLAKLHLATAAHDFAREPRMRLIPTVGLAASVTATTNAQASGRSTDELATLTATWPIFDNGSRYADARSRDASAVIADLTAAQLARTVESQVRAALALLAGAQASLGAAEDAMNASRQSATETAVLYKQGLAKAIELVDANDSRFSAEVAHANAEYAVALAYLGLRQALGLEPLSPDGAR